MMSVALSSFPRLTDWVHWRRRTAGARARQSTAEKRAPVPSREELSICGRRGRLGAILVAQDLATAARTWYPKPLLAPVRSANLGLSRAQHVWLRATLDTHLTSVSGVTWLTFERGTGDVVIPTGQSFVVPAGTTVLIGALRGPVKLLARGAFEAAADGQVDAAVVRDRH